MIRRPPRSTLFPSPTLFRSHRQLDLRRPEMQGNLMLRHRLLQRARRTLSDLEFLEIETPVLTKDRKSTRLNSSHLVISYAVFCLKKKKYWTLCKYVRPACSV